MSPFKHLVVATDLGECSRRAVDLATSLALEGQARLTLVHVLEVPTFAYASDPMMGVDFFTPLLELAEKSLSEELERVRRTLPSAAAVLSRGPAWAELLKIAKEQGCDLVVLGTHGRQGVTRMALGSVAEKVVRMAPIPVLTVSMLKPARATTGVDT